MKVYGRSKLCNILFTRELARRLQSTDVTANCLHPGFVATRFGDQSGALMSRIIWLAKFFAISPAKGAGDDCLSRVLAGRGQDNGTILLLSHYLLSRRLRAQDDQSALLLWQRSAALAGI